MILRPVRPAVAIGAADEEFAGRIDVPDRVLADPALRQRLADVRLDDLAHLVGRQVLDEVLVRHDDLRHADRLAVLVAHGHLALGIRAELRGLALPALRARCRDHRGFCGVIDRRRHQLRRLVAGIAEHDALVAGALFLVVGCLASTPWAMSADCECSSTSILRVGPVKAFLLVADVLDRLAGQMPAIIRDGDALRARAIRRR